MPELQATRRQAPAIYPPDYEARTVEFARKCVDDIGVCADAEIRVQFYSGVPMLLTVFTLPGFEAKPMFALRLVAISQSEPLRQGSLVEGDRLRRAYRQGVETYLHKHGVRIPVADDDFS